MQPREPLATVIVGAVVAGGSFWITGFPILATAAGLCWGVSIGILLRIHRLHPDLVTGTSWADSRWTGLGNGIIVAAALLGISPWLPISPALRLGLGLLVLGVGLLGYMTASIAEMERLAD